MKNTATIKILIMAAFMVVCTESRADGNIAGYWSSEKHQVDIEIVPTRGGIKVLRTGQSNWYYYDESRNNRYRDREGNIYRLTGDDHLEWESYDGRKNLRFRKSHSRNRNRSYGNRGNDYRENRTRRHVIRKRVITPTRLHGSWINQRNGDCLDIRARRSSIRVDGIGLFDRTFHRSNEGFVDRKGNLLRFEDGKLIRYNRRGRVQGIYWRSW